MMKTIRVFIEKGQDGRYSAYMPDDNDLPFGVIGEGETPKEAREDFLVVMEAMREDYDQIIKGLKFEFMNDFQ